jgi:hypothetical protein
MASLRISRFAARPESAVVLRYGAAVILVAVALGTALILRRDNLPHPFTSFFFTAIAITFWCAGTGRVCSRSYSPTGNFGGLGQRPRL